MKTFVAFALGVVVGLAGVALAKEPNSQQYFSIRSAEFDDAIGLHPMIFAHTLGQKILDKCDKTRNYNRLAAKLQDESSPEHKCALENLEDGKFLVNVLRFAQEKQQGELEYLDKIRERQIARSEADSEIEHLIDEAKLACQTFIEKLAPFYEEAKGTHYAKSGDFASKNEARSACQLFLRHSISAEAIAELEEAANEKHQDLNAKHSFMSKMIESM